MKRFILVFLVLTLQLASAARINLYLNDSYLNYGRNISLIDISKEKALICVNNEKAIISKDKTKSVNHVSLVLKKVYKDYIRVDINVNCEDCKCDNNCTNKNCIIITKKEKEELKEVSTDVKEEINENISIELVENEGIKSGSIIITFVILIILIIILYFLVKKR